MTTEAQATNNTPAHETPPDFAEVANSASEAGLVKFDAPAPVLDAQDAELNEMRVISKRLKALDPATRTRVLAWLVAKFS